MKRFKLNLGAVALIMGVALAFTTSAFKAESSATLLTGWYATDSSGNLIQPYQSVNPDEACQGGSVFCAKEYNIENGSPTTPTSTPAAMRPE